MSDDRLDERMAAIDNTFTRIDRTLDDLRTEMRELRHEVREEIRALRADFNAMQDRLTQIGFGLAGILAAQLLTAVVALVIAVS